MADADKDKKLAGVRTLKSDMERLRGDDKPPKVVVKKKPKPKKKSGGFSSYKSNKSGRNAADYLSGNGSSKQNVVAKKPKPETEAIKIVSKETVRETKIDPDMEESLEEGMVIRDKKKRRFKLLPAMMDATKDWAEETKDTIEDISRPKHTVAPAGKRAETIKKAASLSKRAPKEDYKSVAEKFKESDHEPVHSEVVIKEKPAIKASNASWEVPLPGKRKAKSDTHPKKTYSFNKSGEPSASDFLSQADSGKKDETTKSSDSAATIPAPPAAKKDIVLPPPPPPPKEETGEPEPVEPKPEPEKVKKSKKKSKPEEKVPPPPEPKEEVVEEDIEVEIEEPTIESEYYDDDEPSAAAFLDDEESTSRPRKVRRETRPQTSHMPMALTASTVFVAVVVGIIAAWVFIFQNTLLSGGDSDVVIAEPMHFSENITEVEYQADRNDWPTYLLSIASTSGGHRSINFVTGEDNSNANTLVMKQIISENGQLLERTLKEAAFGFDDVNRPYIVIKGTDFDATFAAMLYWEESMVADLSPLMGMGETVSFVDQAYGSKNSRVAIDANENEILVYAFLDKNTVAIATDSEVIDMLSNSLLEAE